MGALRTGGQGSVYKARRMGPILRAVKLLPTPIHSESADDKNYRHFLNEVEKLKKVNQVPNPNVVKILNYGITESGSLPFIEMEFIEGPDLCELLTAPHHKIFTVKEVIKLADQLAGALSHCHRVGVMHGDIKSNNVKFNVNSGNYVLLDFGLSVMSDEQRRSSMRNAGAIEFMAPEQNEGRMLFQTDIYSYGVVLYELLAGRVPFPLQDDGETARNTVMISHLEAPVPDLLKLRKENLPASWSEDQQTREMQVPDWLLAVVYKCLEKLPENRYSDGIALQDSVQISITGNPDNTLIVLKTENEQLQTQLMHYQAETARSKKSAISITKPLFFGLLLSVILLIALCGYAFLTRKKVYQTIQYSKLPPVPLLFLPNIHHILPDTHHKNPPPAAKKVTDTIVKADNIKTKASYTTKGKSLLHPLKKKRHKKKFLGIF